MNKTDEERPLVSIIVRTKDRPKLLIRALSTIFTQTYRPIEVIIVNDGGCEIPEASLRKTLGDLTLNYISLDENTGRAHAGNVGIENAHGEYIGFLDDDDEFYPEHVQTLVSYMEQSIYKAAYTDAEIIDSSYTTEKEEPLTEDKRLLFSKVFSFEELLVGNYIPFMTPLFSREVIERFDESFDLYEDWDLLIRTSQNHPFHHINKVTARYNQWNRELQINQSDSEQMKTAHLKVINKHSKKIIPEVILNMKNKRDELAFKVHYISRDCDILKTQLKDMVREKDSRIMKLDDTVREKDSRIMKLDDTVREKDSRIMKLDDTIREKESRVNGLELILFQMRNTIGWRLLEKFRTVRNKLGAIISKRNKLYDFTANSYKTIRDEGFSIFLKKLKVKTKTGLLGSKISCEISKIKVAMHSIDPEKFRVLFLISPWAGVTNRYRAYNMKEYLNLMGTESEVVGIEELDTQPSYALDFDIIVIHRIPMNEILNALIEKCREVNIPVIFDLDDYLFDVSLTDRIDEIKRMNDTDRNKWIEHVRGCRDTLEACDYFIGTTDYIVDKVRELGKKAFLIRNGLNKIQVEASKKALIQSKHNPDVINIGYFSGTRTHQKDFEVVVRPLIKIMEEYNNVRLCIGGFLDLNSSFKRFSERIERFPYVDWKELPFNIAGTDINIAPLEPDNPFCEAKSELKYFESALLKVPSVCTPTDTYKRAIKNGENGLLASSEEDWYSCLKSLIEDPSLRNSLGERAYKMVMETYSPDIQGQTTLETYKNIIMDYKETEDC